jgi:polar amino acid transport system permease protein
MLKTTSLVTAVPFSLDLYTRSRDISAETYNPIPMLIVASTWYLLFTSILMVGQYFLEKRFARGVADRRPNKKADAATTLLTGALPVVAAGQPTVLLPPAPATGSPGSPDSPTSPADGDVR